MSLWRTEPPSLHVHRPAYHPMLIQLEQFGKVFQLIQEDAVKPGVTVLILVAYDCDAIAACRILTVIPAKGPE